MIVALEKDNYHLGKPKLQFQCLMMSFKPMGKILIIGKEKLVIVSGAIKEKELIVVKKIKNTKIKLKNDLICFNNCFNNR